MCDLVLNDDDRLVSAADGEKVSGLKPETLRRLAWQGRIRSYKVLGALRF
jgi:hypothetical protein